MWRAQNRLLWLKQMPRLSRWLQSGVLESQLVLQARLRSRLLLSELLQSQLLL